MDDRRIERLTSRSQTGVLSKCKASATTTELDALVKEFKLYIYRILFFYRNISPDFFHPIPQTSLPTTQPSSSFTVSLLSRLWFASRTSNIVRLRSNVIITTWLGEICTEAGAVLQVCHAPTNLSQVPSGSARHQSNFLPCRCFSKLVAILAELKTSG